jgi:hypothetical protein
MAAYGISDQGDDPYAGSTDMANVSWVCPSIHPDLAIAPEGTPGHFDPFRDAAATPQADETTLVAATLVAQTAYDLFLDRGSSTRRGEPFARPDAEYRPSADREDPAGTLGGSPSVGCVRYHRPGASRWTIGSNRRRPERDGPPARDDAATVPGGPPWLTARPTPSSTATLRA